MTQYKAELELAGNLADNGEPDKAVEICEKVLLEEPDNPMALYVVGCVTTEAGRWVQAMQIAKRLSELRPKAPLGWSLLATVCACLHKYDDSIRYAEKALACKRDAKTVSDVAFVHVNSGHWEIGRKYALQAIEMAKTDDSKRAQEAMRDSLIHLAYCELATSHWKSGFEGFRRTLRTKWRKEWAYGDSVEWQGESDAVVMVTGEQGLGDEIMAASVIPDAIKGCKQFILDCDHRLVDLFRRSFPGAIVTGTRREQTVALPVLPTHHKALFGLAELFRQKDEDFPRAPYLVPREDYVEMFRALLGPRRTIGLAWSGGFLRTGLEARTAGLNAFLPLIRKEDAQFVSLQYKDDKAEVEKFEAEHGIKVLRFPWATLKDGDVDLLAGLLAACDSVVGVHTSSLHLASALGVPTTFLVHRGSGWRYGPATLPWYGPTTKVHRKKPGESWRDCVSRL